MKPALLFLLVPSSALLAQPVVQYADLTPIGTSFPLHLVVDPGSSDPTPDGANVTWDFSSATLNMNVGTLTWMDPASTPQGSQFPGSNRAQKVVLPTGTFYNYFNAQTTQLDQLANEVGGPDPDIYSDPKTPLIFPFHYQDSFVDNYNDGSPSTVTRSYTGYGTLILPTGTYNNVVKVSNSSGAIVFLTTDPVAQLVNIEDDGTVIVTGDPVQSVQEAHPTSLAAYPVPAQEMVFVSGIRRNSTWRLVDASGRAQAEGKAVPGLLEVPLAQLMTGCYVLHVTDAEESRTVRIVKR